ncbi:MAG: branched-chain amino acid transaminase [Candidatus Actinomarina sp.]|jgi:branched-chain amino acid aminotransferase|nr:branched chain amino acid aminotransferase [Actinomycetota bacterium]MDG1201522.1 branched-chain amino acid transaminase [Candidatus Actinomarina sp.]MBT3873894.1 branched-chain amino acid transaminase [Actinomycetota bacterium]MDG1228890.1 branched-chain amino acid transaminase [Candidatus Actinomarina sp.]MDG1740808.1 branched-chain amino acid transaminase [Candidatus Actinomarina sp.]|tara:strand:- start:1501 stop:2415 length:915 start_codon:yes stop_codon:yes gene_type:complete
MKKSEFIWLDGELVEWDNANVSVMTHTLHYGTGVFEGMRARETEKGTSVQFLDDHVDRLYRSAEAYNLEIPFNKNVISNAIKEIVKVNKLKSAYIRPLVFFGDGEMGLLPQDIPVRVAIAAWEWGAYLGDDAGSQGVNVCISDWQRISPKSFKPFAKGVGGYMNSTLAKIDAVKEGFDDAIMLSDNGTVAEGSGQNIFIYKNDQLLTPSIETGALGGITRKMVIEIANYLDIPVVEQDLSPADLIASDEIFFTGTATEIVGVVSVDSNKISDGTVGEVTSKIRTKYLEIVNGQDDNFKNYITLI